MKSGLAFLDMLGGPEIMLIMVVVLIFFGGEKMPGFARGLGKVIRELKKAANDVESEFKRAMDEGEHPPPVRPALPPVAPNPDASAAPPVSIPHPRSPIPDNHYDDTVE
jgi:TatA/E family protein of Tat protein translocase